MTASRADIDAAWRALTSAVARRDGSAALTGVVAGQSVGLLQGAGPAVLLAVVQHVPGAGAAAELLAGALTGRGWDGDDVLAQLLTSTTDGVVTGRSAVVVDLEELGEVMAGGQGGWLDLGSGFAWPQEILDDDGPEDVSGPEDDPDRWLEIGMSGSRDAWQDMADFLDTITAGGARDDLELAIHGSGAFKRFQPALDRHSELRAPWRVHSSERYIGRARAWLADSGYDAVP